MRDVIFRYRDSAQESVPTELKVSVSTYCDEGSFSFVAFTALKCAVKDYNLYYDRQFTLLVNDALIDPLLTVQDAFRDTSSITVDATVQSHLDCMDFEELRVHAQHSDEWESRSDFPPTLYWLSVFKSSVWNWCIVSYFVKREDGELTTDDKMCRFSEYELPEIREPYMDRRYAAIVDYINKQDPKSF